ncbi:MAG: response regulator [Phycisphaerae bacterium]
MKSLVAAWDVLVVDTDPGVGELVREQSSGLASRVRVATSVDQAQAEMKSKPADVLLVNMQINDNAGAELIRALRRKYPKTELIAMSRSKRSEVCLDAWRAGATDMILGPVQAEEVQRSLNGVAERRGQIEKLTKRNLRLRQVCKQLNKARHEIGQQVDLLCNDLVRAYQEMAQQLNVTQLTAEYCQAVDEEIEVEGILRKTMEWVLKKIGPINAAVYLPDTDRHFALGAYLNLDTEADALLISDIGETVVKQAESAGQALSIGDDRSIEHLFGAAGERLKGRTWLSMACNVRRECLAVIVIFRNSGQAIDASVRTMVETMAPALGERIDQALGLYHRMHPYDYEDEASGDEEAR